MTPSVFPTVSFKLIVDSNGIFVPANKELVSDLIPTFVELTYRVTG